jgi:hypothetical protein
MAKISDEKTSLLDSAIGPVAVTTTKYSQFSIDDYVSITVKSKAEYLRLLKKAAEVNPLEAENRPPVSIGGINLGGYSA